MNRRSLLLALPALTLPALRSRASLPAREREATVAFVLSLRNRDGGYRAGSAAGPSSVAATTNCLRSLKYLKASPDSRPLAFINQCIKEGGGIADTPDGEPTVRSTAIGLMALVDLNVPLRFGLGNEIGNYLSQNAKTLPDIYIAAAALQAAGVKTPKARAWIRQWETARFTEAGLKSPADTAGGIIVALRLGGKPRDLGSGRRILVTSQRPDGGWSADGLVSDLATTYRVVRALHMTDGRPDLARLRNFVGSCRNPDAGYGVAPGRASSAAATYYSAICLHWAEDMAR